MTLTQPSASILARLKSETRAEHDAIEAALGLTQRKLTHIAYRHIVERFYGFYRPLEVALQSTFRLPGHRIDLTERLKTPLLEADLRTLGVEFRDVPVCASLPSLMGEAERFGCLYVLEGSTLGGQLISRHVQQSIGLTPETGARFFHGYGADTGRMWQQFRAALTDCVVSQASQDAAVAAAKDTFQKLHCWIAAQGSR